MFYLAHIHVPFLPHPKFIPSTQRTHTQKQNSGLDVRTQPSQCSEWANYLLIGQLPYLIFHAPDVPGRTAQSSLSFISKIRAHFVMEYDMTLN